MGDLVASLQDNLEDDEVAVDDDDAEEDFAAELAIFLWDDLPVGRLVEKCLRERIDERLRMPAWMRPSSEMRFRAPTFPRWRWYLWYS